MGTPAKIVKIRTIIKNEFRGSVELDGDIHLAKNHIVNWGEGLPWKRLQAEAKDNGIDLEIPEWLAVQRGLL